MKRKIIIGTIGDLHGKDSWKNIIENNPQVQKWVFTGDYVDDFMISDADMFENLNNVIDYKKKNPDNIILLWGNHEQHYLFANPQYHCSGFRISMFPIIHQTLNGNKKLFQYAFQHKDHIWTHAGIHVGWWEYVYKGNLEENIANQLNTTFNAKDINYSDSKIESLFDCGHDRGGDRQIGGPLWVDKNTIWEKGIPKYHQIVGHSRVSEIKKCRSREDGSITFCDCLHSVEQCHIVEI